MHSRKLILVVALLFCFPLIATAQDVFLKDDGWYSTIDITMSKAVGRTSKIVVMSAENLSGRLDVIATPDDSVSIVYTKEARTKSRSTAFDYIDLISVSLDLLPKEARIELRAPNPPPWEKQGESAVVVARLYVPEHCRIQIEAAYFDVTARGPFEEVVIPSSLGRIEINDVENKLEVKTANQRLTLERISGSISATTTNSSLVARSIYARDQARFRNEGGPIRIEGFTGAINARNSFGPINISSFHPSGEGSFIRGSSEPITLEIVEMSEGQLVVSNRHEDIDITIPDSLSAFFSLSVDEEGTIEAAGFPFTTDLVKQTRLNLISGDGDIDISGSVRGRGSIFIRGVGEN